MNNKTWEKMTKLEAKTKVRIVIHILIAILSLVTAGIEKNGAWAICGMLWITIAVMEYCDNKLLKGSDALAEIQEQHIKVQNEMIDDLLKKLSEQTKIIDITRIKIPKHFTKPRQKKLEERWDYAVKNGKFKVPVIIDKDNNLKDGYTSYLVAKSLGLEEIEAKVVNE